jgi:hypothetical protein
LESFERRDIKAIKKPVQPPQINKPKPEKKEKPKNQQPKPILLAEP